MISSRAGLVISLMFVLAAPTICGADQCETPATCPVGGYPLTSCPLPTDAVIAQTIRARYSGLFVAPCQQVDVTVIGGVVILTGYVRTRAQWDTANILASSVRGVIRIDNRLCVAPIKDADLKIQRQVMSAIRRSFYNSQQVSATVQDGIVTLTGVVGDEYTRSMIGLTVEGIPGVTAVQNGIAISQLSWTY